jgi:hypothetical protein
MLLEEEGPLKQERLHRVNLQQLRHLRENK